MAGMTVRIIYPQFPDTASIKIDGYANQDLRIVLPSILPMPNAIVWQELHQPLCNARIRHNIGT
jgi:hypothetical protein